MRTVNLHQLNIYRRIYNGKVNTPAPGDMETNSDDLVLFLIFKKNCIGERSGNVYNYKSHIRCLMMTLIMKMSRDREKEG